MYAPSIPTEIQERLPFVRFVSTIEDAISVARRRAREGAEVLVFPSGGITYPELGGKAS